MKKSPVGMDGMDQGFPQVSGEGVANESGLINQEVIPQLDRLYQTPQGREDRQMGAYDNDVKPNWLRGMGKGEACGKPHFDYGPSGSRYGK